MERRGFLKGVAGVLAFFGIGTKEKARKLFAEAFKPGPSVTCRKCGWSGEANLLNPMVGPVDDDGGRTLTWAYSETPKCANCGHDDRLKS